MTDKKPTESDYDDEGFAVIWSEGDGEYVGLAKHFPSMSWLAATPDEASAGIRRVVLETGIANIAANDRLLLDRLGNASKRFHAPKPTEPESGLSNAEILAELRDDH